MSDIPFEISRTNPGDNEPTMSCNFCSNSGRLRPLTIVKLPNSRNSRQVFACCDECAGRFAMMLEGSAAYLRINAKR